MRAGIAATWVYGLATIAAGVIDLLWGNFDPGHQPIQAFGDHIPGRAALAYIAGVWLIAAGGAILWRGTARVGAVAAGLIYLVFAVFWTPRFYTAPQVLGYRATVYIGVLGGVAQQLILVAAAVILYASAAPREPGRRSAAARFARWTFGLSSIDFGLAHLTGTRAVAPIVPKWIPLGGDFWTVMTGIAFVLAGAAILARILDVLAARLLALMLLVFSVLVLAPKILAYTHSQAAWGGNAYNLAAIGAVWIFAEQAKRER